MCVKPLQCDTMYAINYHCEYQLRHAFTKTLINTDIYVVHTFQIMCYNN